MDNTKDEIIGQIRNIKVFCGNVIRLTLQEDKKNLGHFSKARFLLDNGLTVTHTLKVESITKVGSLAIADTKSPSPAELPKIIWDISEVINKKNECPISMVYTEWLTNDAKGDNVTYCYIAEYQINDLVITE